MLFLFLLLFRERRSPLQRWRVRFRVLEGIRLAFERFRVLEGDSSGFRMFSSIRRGRVLERFRVLEGEPSGFRPPQSGLVFSRRKRGAGRGIAPEHR